MDSFCNDYADTVSRSIDDIAMTVEMTTNELSARTPSDSESIDRVGKSQHHESNENFYSRENTGDNTSKVTRINWAKSPNRERLSQIVHDWFSRTGMAVDDITKEIITDYKVYADKVGISDKTLFKYICKDPRKRRTLHESGSGRGKKRLIDEEGIQSIIKKLKTMAELSHGFSRQEAISLIADQFGLCKKAATRQFVLHILPKMTLDGLTLVGTDSGENPPVGVQPPQQHQHNHNDLQKQKQHRRSIVISGVTSDQGRALLEYFYNRGHIVAGCGRSPEDIRSLQSLFPQSKLHVVDVLDDKAVERWSSFVGLDVDLVIANVELCPEITCQSLTWEVTCDVFHRTMDTYVKGMSNMVRHFIPRLIQKNNPVQSMKPVSEERVFVAMTSNLGMHIDPFLSAHSASSNAVEGLMKCIAMSVPEPLCVITFDCSTARNSRQHEKLVGNTMNGSNWVDVAAPILLRANRQNNGKSMGLYS